MNAQEHHDAQRARFYKTRAKLLDYAHAHLRYYLDGSSGFNFQLIPVGSRQELKHMATLWCKGDSHRQRKIVCQFTASDQFLAMDKLWELVKQLPYQDQNDNESSG